MTVWARWVALPVKGTQMRRLNLAYFMRLGAALDEINDFDLMMNPEKPHWVHKVAKAQEMLVGLLSADIPLSIPASTVEINTLLRFIEAFKADTDETRKTDKGLWSQASKVQTLIEGELAIQAVYYVMPKRAYDTSRLVANGASAFSEQVQQWLNDEETYDIVQAGRCIAFETPTAAGFHLIRAAESVIRRYFAAVVGRLPSAKMRSWGVYVGKLRDCGADPKVVAAIEQVKDFHRNLVMHPEDQLSDEEAVSLLGIVESLISAIYRDMAARDAAGDTLLKLLEGGGQAA